MNQKKVTRGDKKRSAKPHIAHATAGTAKHDETKITDEKKYVQLGEQIKAAEEDAKSHYDKLLRVMAEFENFKKRVNKEASDNLKYSNEKILTALLPILDDLDRVVDHIPEHAAKEVKDISHGLELVRKNMIASLKQHGLHEIAALGMPFDPNHHEAISTGQTPDQEADTVMTVHRKGYMLHDRLLRAAMVTVNK